jgi:transcriptional regulator with XRE-family HTH domain
MTEQDDSVLVAFGEFVKAQRRLAQVSQRNLARMSGVSDSYLSQIERGNYRPSPQVVKRSRRRSASSRAALHDARLHGRRDERRQRTVEQAIQLDPKLEPAQKDALIRVYRSFLEKG